MAAVNPGFDEAAIFPASNEALTNLFTDVFLANLQDRIGEPRLSIDTGVEVKAIGFGEFLAAEIIDALVQAGITQEGRPIDLSQVSTGGLQRIYPAASDVADAMTRRASDLRRKGRLLGGTYNPLIKTGQVVPGVVGRWTASFAVASFGEIDLELPDDALLSISFRISPANNPAVVSVATFTETVSDITLGQQSQTVTVPGLRNVTFFFQGIKGARRLRIHATASAGPGGSPEDYSDVTMLIYRIPAGAVGEPGARGAVGPQGQAGNDARGDITDTEFSNVLGALWGEPRDVVWNNFSEPNGARFTTTTEDGNTVVTGLEFNFATNAAAVTYTNELKASNADAVWLRTYGLQPEEDINLRGTGGFAWFDGRNITKQWSVYLDTNEVRVSFSSLPGDEYYLAALALVTGATIKVTVIGNVNKPERVGKTASMILGFDPVGRRTTNGVFFVSLRRDLSFGWTTPGGITGLDPTNPCDHACDDVIKVEWVKGASTFVYGDIIMDLDQTTITVPTDATYGNITLNDRLWSLNGQSIGGFALPATERNGWIRFNDRAGVPSTGSGGGGGGGGGSGTDVEGDVSNEEFSGFLTTIYGPPSTINYKDNIGTTAGDGIVSTGNTETFGSDTFIGYKLNSAKAAAAIADNLLAGDGVLTNVREADTGTVYGESVAALFPTSRGGTTSVGLAPYPNVRSTTTSLSFYYATRADAEASVWATLKSGDRIVFTAISTSDGGTSTRVGQSSTFRLTSNIKTYRTFNRTNPPATNARISLFGSWSGDFNDTDTAPGYNGNDLSSAADSKWINYRITAPGSGFKEEKAAEIMGTIAGVDIVETDVLRIWLGKELWTVGEDQWGDIPNGKGELRFLRGLGNRAAMELPGVPTTIFGGSATGRLGNIPTADLAAHIVGPTGREFELEGTWQLQSGLPSSARRISISGSGQNRTVNITGTSTAADRVNQHLQSFIADGYNWTMRLASANTGGWRFKVIPVINVNTVANGGWGFTATTISGTPPTGSGTYDLFVEGDIVRWSEFYSEGVKDTVKAGAGVTIDTDDADEELTVKANKQPGRWIFASTEQWADDAATTAVTYDTNVPWAATDKNLNIFKLFYSDADGPTGFKYESIEIRGNTIPTAYSETNGRWIIYGTVTRKLYLWQTSYTSGGSTLTRINVRRSTDDVRPYLSMFYIFAPVDGVLPTGGG